jgi:adenylate kinase
VWREEEILATEVLATPSAATAHFYVLARGDEDSDTAESLYRLMFEPEIKRVYPSFPMTHVMDMPDVLAEIDTFRDAPRRAFHHLRSGRPRREAAAVRRREATKERRADITLA